MFTHSNQNEGDFSVHFLVDDLLLKEANAIASEEKNPLNSNSMVLEEIDACIHNAGQGQIG